WGNFRSFSSLVTGIASMRTVTRRGWGKCEYQCHVHVPAHEIRKIAMIADAIRRGCAFSRQFQFSPMRAIHCGFCQEIFPKICPGIRRAKAATAITCLMALERDSGVFMRWIRRPDENLSGIGGSRSPNATDRLRRSRSTLLVSG